MFDKRDQTHVTNLIKLLNKAKMELEGQEILAAGDVLRWVGMLSQKIQEDIKHQEEQAKFLAGKEAILPTMPGPALEPEKSKKPRKVKE